MRATSNAVVDAFRVLRSDLTKAGIPPTGSAVNAAFFATIPERALRIVGLIAVTALRMDCPSDSDMGRGVRACNITHMSMMST